MRNPAYFSQLSAVKYSPRRKFQNAAGNVASVPEEITEIESVETLNTNNRPIAFGPEVPVIESRIPFAKRTPSSEPVTLPTSYTETVVTSAPSALPRPEGESIDFSESQQIPSPSTGVFESPAPETPPFDQPLTLTQILRETELWIESPNETSSLPESPHVPSHVAPPVTSVEAPRTIGRSAPSVETKISIGTLRVVVEGGMSANSASPRPTTTTQRTARLARSTTRGGFG